MLTWSNILRASEAANAMPLGLVLNSINYSWIYFRSTLPSEPTPDSLGQRSSIHAVVPRRAEQVTPKPTSSQP